MSKPPVKFPYELKSNGRVGKIYFKPSTGQFNPRFTFAGKRRENAFTDFDEALKWLKTELDKLDLDAANSVALYPVRFPIRHYYELEQLLRVEAPGASLRDTVDFYLAFRESKTFTALSVAECAEKCVADQRNKNSSLWHIDTIKKHYSRFGKQFGSRQIHTITAAEITSWLNTRVDEKTGEAWGAKTRKNVRGSLVSLSIFSRDILKAIPETGQTEFEKVGEPKTDAIEEVGIYSTAEIEKLLLTALQTDLDMIPVIVLGSFQGLRPSEIHGEKCKRPRLKWEDLAWELDRMYIRGQKVRSKKTRDVPLFPVTQAWLEPFRDLKGPIWEHKQAHSKKLIALRTRAKVKSLEDGFRHSYASYRIRETNDLNLVAAEMGNSPQELMDSYKRNVPLSEVKVWFGLMPPEAYAEQVKASLKVTV